MLPCIENLYIFPWQSVHIFTFVPEAMIFYSCFRQHWESSVHPEIFLPLWCWWQWQLRDNFSLSVGETAQSEEKNPPYKTLLQSWSSRQQKKAELIGQRLVRGQCMFWLPGSQEHPQPCLSLPMAQHPTSTLRAVSPCPSGAAPGSVISSPRPEPGLDLPLPRIQGGTWCPRMRLPWCPWLPSSCMMGRMASRTVLASRTHPNKRPGGSPTILAPGSPDLPPIHVPGLICL